VSPYAVTTVRLLNSARASLLMKRNYLRELELAARPRSASSREASVHPPACVGLTSSRFEEQNAGDSGRDLARDLGGDQGGSHQLLRVGPSHQLLRAGPTKAGAPTSSRWIWGHLLRGAGSRRTWVPGQAARLYAALDFLLRRRAAIDPSPARPRPARKSVPGSGAVATDADHWEIFA